MNKQNRSHIISVGYYLPERIIKTIEIEKKLQFKERFGLPYGLLEKLTGCREFRQASPEMDASDLAVKASKDALNRINISPVKIDLIIFCACVQDIMEPATANIIQTKLGAKNSQVFDVKNACNAFLNGIDIADSFISTGRAEVVLVASGEISTRWVDYQIKNTAELKYRMAGLTLGDAGGALIMAKANPDERGIVGSFFETSGEYWDLAVVMSGGTKYPRGLDDDYTYFSSDSEKIINLAREKVSEAIVKLLERLKWKPLDVDLVVSHQVTRKIIKDIADRVNIPFERCMVTVDRYGNTAAASIPVALGTALDTGRLKPGMRVLLIGGASGFSAGVVALIW